MDWVNRRVTRRSVVPSDLYSSRFEHDISSMDHLKGRSLVASNGGALIVLLHNDDDPADESSSIFFLSSSAHLLQLNVVRWFPSARVALSGGADATAHIWDLEDEADFSPVPAASLRGGGHATGLLSLGFVGPVGAEVVTGARDGALLWSVATQTALSRLLPASESVTCIGNGLQSVLLGSQSGTVWQADVRSSPAPVLQWTGLKSINAGGAISCYHQLHPDHTHDHVMRFGTDRGLIVEYDRRKPGDEILQTLVQRPDGAAITSLFGERHYSTSLGVVASFQGNDDFLIAEEAGQAIVSVRPTGGRGFIAASTSHLIEF